jgi:hypothetical protein
MRPEDLRQFVRKQPFQPFRIVTTKGSKYEIHHPDRLIVLRTRFVVGTYDIDGVPDRSEEVALSDIQDVELL